MPILKVNYAFIVPWIVLSIPSAALLREEGLVIVILTVLGVVGMVTVTPALAMTASVSLIGLLVWGKVTADLLSLGGPDSAVFLLQFMLVILLMEASSTVLSLERAYKRLSRQNDVLSAEARSRVSLWGMTQLMSLGKLTLAAFLLSLTLLLFGSIVSISLNQIAFTGALVIIAVTALLILLTYRREPETARGRLAKV